MIKGDKMFTIGKIINTHGIKGEVKVKQITDFEERFTKGSTVYLINQDEQQLELVVDGYRTQQDILLIHFTGYDSIDSVEGLDRKSTRLNSSHVAISYAVFCLNT